MLLEGSGEKRAVIYVFYDKDGIVDDYIPFMLAELKRNSKYIQIVVNGEVSDEGRKKLLPYCDDFLIRENTGYDVTGYIEGIKHIGLDRLSQYDEIILTNDTLFGPIYPFSEMFFAMDKKDIDFWGILGSDYVDSDVAVKGASSYHIQSFFLALRKSLFLSNEFKNKLVNFPKIKDYNDARKKFEVVFSAEFSSYGFKYETYIDSSDLSGYCTNASLWAADKLIQKRCPIIKKKAFSFALDAFIDINSTVKAFDFIKLNTSYSAELIWQNLLRTQNLANIKSMLKLNFILPENHVSNSVSPRLRCALLAHIFYEDIVDQTLSYAESMPNYADMYFTVSNPAFKPVLEKEVARRFGERARVILVKGRGRSESAFLIELAKCAKGYDVACFVHDKKSRNAKPYIDGEMFADKCFDNLLGSKEYVLKILSVFEKEPNLGMLMPPPPSNGIYEVPFTDQWGKNFANTELLAQKLGIHVPLESSKVPIAPLGGMFWFRPKALYPITSFDWHYDDFPCEPLENDGTLLHAIERVYCYAAQQAGYYSGWCMSERYAGYEINALHQLVFKYSHNGFVFKRFILENLPDSVVLTLVKIKHFIKPPRKN